MTIGILEIDLSCPSNSMISMIALANIPVCVITVHGVAPPPLWQKILLHCPRIDWVGPGAFIGYANSVHVHSPPPLVAEDPAAGPQN